MTLVLYAYCYSEAVSQYYVTLLCEIAGIEFSKEALDTLVDGNGQGRRRGGRLRGIQSLARISVGDSRYRSVTLEGMIACCFVSTNTLKDLGLIPLAILSQSCPKVSSHHIVQPPPRSGCSR